MKETLLFMDIVIDVLFLICAIIILANAISLGKVVVIISGIIGYTIWIVLTVRAIIEYIKWKRGDK